MLTQMRGNLWGPGEDRRAEYVIRVLIPDRSASGQALIFEMQLP